MKVADLEDHSRRNHINFTGIPENIKPPNLIPYLQQLFLKFLPQLSKADIIIDCAHRIAKPNHLPVSIPRDVLAQIHFFHIKERIVAAARSASKLPDPYSSVSLFTDIATATAQKHREFSQVTAVLRDNNVTYKWGFPTKLLVTYQNQSTNISTPKEGIKRLLNWSLLTSPPPDPKPQCPCM